MLDLNSESISFKTEAEVEAYTRFFLDSKPLDARKEYETDEEYQAFLLRRERLLKAQLDYLRELNFSKANRTRCQVVSRQELGGYC